MLEIKQYLTNANGEPATDSDIWSMLFGSSGDYMPWYPKEIGFLEGDWDKIGVAVITAYHPDDYEIVDEPRVITKQVNLEDVKTAITVLFARSNPRFVSENMNTDNWDAEFADCVLQTIMYNEIVFG
jgi:hypothetical protein